MALKDNFYNEITENEKKWIELIKDNLLNVVYCNLELKPFYIEKKKELEEEYIKTGNVIIGDTLGIIKSIVDKLEEFNNFYKESKFIDFKSLLPLFLTNQMNNSLQSQNTSDVNRLDIRRQIIEDEIRKYSAQKNFQDDYLYDDFPEEHKKVI